MKQFINQIKEKVLQGKDIDKKEALVLMVFNETEPEIIETIFDVANEIRREFMGNQVNLCTIMNVKSGRCSEDCKYCAQSVHYKTGIQEYELLQYDEILERALEMQKHKVHRFSLVSSGRTIDDMEFEKLLEIYYRLKKDTGLELCASHGIISYDKALKLKEAGVCAYHHNLETSRNFYNNICNTHKYQDRLDTIENAKKAGLDVCCGGIIGIGESINDRIEMAFEIKRLGIRSIPINILDPIKGTPLENLSILSPIEILKTMAVYRFILPDAFIRYAGGRKALGSMQNVGFQAGVNAALVGDYLTTVGKKIQEDIEMIEMEGLII
jgi:biotin synthase